MNNYKKHNPRNSKLTFKTTLEVEEAMKLLAEQENKTVSTYLHDVVLNHYCKLMQAQDTVKNHLGYSQQTLST